MDATAPDNTNRAPLAPAGEGGAAGVQPQTAGASLGEEDELAFAIAFSEALIGGGMLVGGNILSNQSSPLPMLDPARRIQDLRKQEEKRAKEDERRRQERRREERS